MKPTSAVRRLFGHYADYHRHGPLMLHYLGILGVVLYPAFYLLRFVKPERPYDDLAFRLVAMVFCGGLLLRERWPKRLKPFFLPYSYIAIIFSLPVMFIFTALKNDGGPVGVGNTLMTILFVILLTDWRNMIVVLAVGTLISVALYVLTDARPQMPADYVARLPLFAFAIVGGTFFKLAAERATADRVRSAYASLAGSIAHEMRNPLGQIRHSLETMQRALPAPTTVAQAQALRADAVNTLYKGLAQGQIAVRRGLQVISMTLDEVNAKPLDAASFVCLSAADVCARALQEYGYEDDDQRGKVGLTVGRDFAFRGDETAFVFVLFNLIKNSLYYTTAFPKARLMITVDQDKVLVSDTGPGIAQEQLRTLFEPFNSTGKAGGTGLGLAFCRRVMQAFGGQISCDSTLGHATVFTLTFPPLSAQEQQTHRAAVIARAQRLFIGKRVLLVDDDSALRMVTRHKLLPLEAAVDEAADGPQAIAMLSQLKYDLVVLDLSMPVLDGYAVAQSIRAGAAPANRDTVIVAHSSEPAHLSRVKTQNVGINAFVSKPSDQVPLILALSQAMEAAIEAAAQAEVAARAPLAGRSILVADDNAYNRSAVAGYLRHAGMRVTEADCGENAIEQLRQMQSCDAILMDINMPGIGGLEAARTIRTGMLRWRDLPIIALTAHSGAEIESAARVAGMHGLLTKPIDANLLLDMLRAQLVPNDGVSEFTAAPAPTHASALLDLPRLENHVRIGILDELVREYLPQMMVLVDRLEIAGAAGDFNACTEALHSLVGMSGEAGAHGLHQYARGIYVPMLEEKRWPPHADWPRDIRALATATDVALREFASRSAHSH